MKTKTLVPFLALTFALTWGIAALLIFFNDQVVAVFGEITASNPLFILAVYAPAFAGVFLVWRYYGLKGLGSFFRRLTLWRMPRVWWLFLLLGIPALAYLAAALNGTISDPFPFSPWVSGISSAGGKLLPGYPRGVRLAGGSPAAAAAQDWLPFGLA